MTLPSPIGGRTTEQVGYFEHDPEGLALWIRGGLGDDWSIVRPAWVSLGDAVADLVPVAPTSRYAVVPAGDWTLLLNNGPLGTDVGVIPSLAARELGCRGIRAVSTSDEDPFPAQMIEVYGPGGASPLLLQRSIVAAKDGDRWVFETSGEPFPFEDLAAYTRRAKASRLTSTMVREYLRGLGVSSDVEPKWGSAILVQRRL